MTAATLDATTVQGILKRYFKNTAVQNSIAAKKSAVWKMMKKTTDGGGDYCSFTQVLNDPFTVSPDFDVAQDLAKTSTVNVGLKFNMPWQELNAPIRVSAKANQLTQTNKVAWFKAIGLAAAAAMRMAHHWLSIQALGHGWGELANSGIVYGGSGATFSVINGAVNKFVEGMPLVFADDATSMHTNALRSATAIKVTNVDYGTGDITCDTALTTPGAQNGDYVFLSGARQNLGSGTAVRVCPVGARDWLPEVRPVTDTTISTLEGTARTGSSRAYGNWVDGTGKDDLDALAELATASVVIGNATSLKCTVSYKRYQAMANGLRTDRRFEDTNGNSGFIKLSIAGADINVEIEVDKNQEDDVGYMWQAGAYEAVGAGEIPFIQDQGGQWVRVSDDNSSELRVYAVYAFIMNDPAACGVCSFEALS
jgi:hypothetical protein